jgi:hypothetical protein
MSVTVIKRGFKRREFLSSALALSGMTAVSSVVGLSRVWGATSHQPLDPVNPDMLFGTTSSMWRGTHDIVWAGSGGGGEGEKFSAPGGCPVVLGGRRREGQERERQQGWGKTGR